MKGFELTLAKVKSLIEAGDFAYADEILRPHTRFPAPRYIDEICELETQVVDGLMRNKH